MKIGAPHARVLSPEMVAQSALCLYTGGQAGAPVDRRSFIGTLAGGFLAARKLLDPVLGEALDHPFTII